MSETATKTCLDCATEIPNAARRCPNCQEWQDPKARRQKHADRISKNFNKHTSAFAIGSFKKFGPFAILAVVVCALGLVFIAYRVYSH